MHRTRNGFTLIEILLVLAILGIISAIAIPSYLGQRHRARMIGVVATSARVIAMSLETTKADTGVYGPNNATAAWAYNSSTPTLGGYTANPCPGFDPASSNRGNIKIEYTVTVGPTGLTYTLDARDASAGAPVLVYQVDQNGRVLFQVPN